VPSTPGRWRVEREGFETQEFIFSPPEIVLTPEGQYPGMVRVPGAPNEGFNPPAPFEDYYLDKYEVTNNQFKEFVDSGGYREPSYWKVPFVKNGQALPFEEALNEFRDQTGRAGPATWEAGTFSEGMENYPVSGVSWFEAAAYCEWAEKMLPTTHHWRNAAGNWFVGSYIVKMSNFSGEGPAPVGSYQGLGVRGTYDMGGNVAEWCWNESGEWRLTEGGAWDDPVYMFLHTDRRSPFTREERLGFRCAKCNEPLPDDLTSPVTWSPRDYSGEEPAGEEAFETLRKFYAYDPSPLNVIAEPFESNSKEWSRERITFDAAYGGEQVIAYLYLPNGGTPPFQTVVYFPGSGAQYTNSIDRESFFVDFVVRSGRALMYPVYKGTHERRSGLPSLQELARAPQGETAWREREIQLFQDLARSLDYLETRDDIDSNRFAFYGFSWGAWFGTIITAIEERFKASVLVCGGLPDWQQPLETDPINFVTRVKVPTLLINGREDFAFPLETSVRPLFRLLGVAESDRKLVVVESGHIPDRLPTIKETLSWLDRYLGPVERR
jgi:dienelactone hydrolase